MNLSETARLLGAMAAFDRRTVGDADVIAWQAVMEDISFQDAMAAVKQHYSDDDAWLMPMHVRRAVKAMEEQRDRVASANPWAPGQWGTPKAEAAPELPSGERMTEVSLSPKVVSLLKQLRAALPEGDPNALTPRREYWDQEHRAYLRSQTGEPNPFYKPRAVEPDA